MNIKQIRRTRAIYGTSFFAIGFGFTLLAIWIWGFEITVLDAVVAGMALAGVGLLLAEKCHSLPKVDDLPILYLRDEMAPSDFSDKDRIPITLMTKAEREKQL